MTSDLIRVDMHLHTYRSFDCLSRPQAILAAAAERGIDRLIITDHNEIRGALEKVLAEDRGGGDVEEEGSGLGVAGEGVATHEGVVGRAGEGFDGCEVAAICEALGDVGAPGGDGGDAVGAVGGGVVVLDEGGQSLLDPRGVVLTEAEQVANELDLSAVNMRFVKPLDTELLQQLADSHELLVTLEENAIMGGAGSAVNEWLLAQGIQVQVLNLGLPDLYIEHDKPANMLAECGLDVDGAEEGSETGD